MWWFIIRVLHIISGNDGGGAKTHLLNICKNSKGMFENTIGCINKGVLYEEAVKAGLWVTAFSQKSRMDLGLIHQIKSFISTNNIDIINFHGANPNFIHLFLKGRIQVKCVTTLHSDYRYDFLNNKLKHIVFTPLNSIALRKFDNFICVSERIKELLDEKGFEGNKFVVNNGININIEVSTCPKSIRERYSIGNSDFLYVMVARMHPIKNHMGLIEAFKILVGQYEDVKLLLVGDGDCERAVKSKVKELNLDKYIKFAGYQEMPVDFINAADVNLLTSYNETFPIVILEGALVKKSAVASDVGDLDKIITSDTGFLFNPNSSHDMYHKLKAAYVNKNLLDDMGCNLYNVVIKNYSIDKFCGRYFDAYERILAGETI